VTTPEPATARGEETRQRIIDAALRLFEEKGYAKTTMRAIAAEAGVSVGNAYYYFASKEHLIQGFYERIQTLHQARAVEVITGEQSLSQRWMAMELAFIDVSAPYHQFAGKFFAIAAEPASPLSPFSDESQLARQASIDIMGRLVSDNRTKGDKRLMTELPELLWLAHLGIVLFWVHDRTPDQQRTRLLIRRVGPLVERVLAVSRLRPLRSVLHQTLDVIAELRS